MGRRSPHTCIQGAHAHGDCRFLHAAEAAGVLFFVEIKIEMYIAEVAETEDENDANVDNAGDADGAIARTRTVQYNKIQQKSKTQDQTEYDEYAN